MKATQIEGRMRRSFWMAAAVCIGLSGLQGCALEVDEPDDIYTVDEERPGTVGQPQTLDAVELGAGEGGEGEGGQAGDGEGQDASNAHTSESSIFPGGEREEPDPEPWQNSGMPMPAGGTTGGSGNGSGSGMSDP